MRKAINRLESAFQALFAAGLLFTTITPASGVILGSHVDNGDGTFTYSYQVDNTSGAFDVFGWSLEFDFATPDWMQDEIPFGDVTVPSDWFATDGIPLVGQSAQDFYSLDPLADVFAGTILDGFSFTSAFGPGTVLYHEFSALGDFASGTVIGPTFVQHVPDSGEWVSSLAIGGMLLFAVGTRTKRMMA